MNHQAVLIYHHNTPTGFYSCPACDFIGEIAKGVEHAVVNQFRVAEPKHDVSNVKLAGKEYPDKHSRKL